MFVSAPMRGPKRRELTQRVEDLIAAQPMLLSELSSRRRDVVDCVCSLNKFYARVGSHWRIRGERRGNADVLYRFVMEGV